mmetsp:Transcript_25201/g.40906  ORF Transcript_25201/g.40906 Transcript_25201/m.40906 type:complete len:436 (+) Transcript_25201:246-1553(+)
MYCFFFVYVLLAMRYYRIRCKSCRNLYWRYDCIYILLYHKTSGAFSCNSLCWPKAHCIDLFLRDADLQHLLRVGAQGVVVPLAAAEHRVLQVLDHGALGGHHLVQRTHQVGHLLPVQIGGLHHLLELGGGLLEALAHGLQAALQQQVAEVRLLLHGAHRGLEPLVEVVALVLGRRARLLEPRVLLGQGPEPAGQRRAPRPRVPQAQLVFGPVLQLPAQPGHRRHRRRQRLRQLLVLLGDVVHELLVGHGLVLALLHLVLQALNELEVVVGDVVVVLLHLAEGLLVVLHQVIDVQVLALLDFVHRHLPLQLQVRLQLGEALVAAGPQVGQVVLEALAHLPQVLLVRLPLQQHRGRVLQVLLHQLQLHLFLFSFDLKLICVMLLLLLAQKTTTFLIDVFQIVLMLVFKMFDFLHVDSNLNTMVVFHKFHLSFFCCNL